MLLLLPAPEVEVMIDEEVELELETSVGCGNIACTCDCSCDCNRAGLCALLIDIVATNPRLRRLPSAPAVPATALPTDPDPDPADGLEVN